MSLSSSVVLRHLEKLASLFGIRLWILIVVFSVIFLIFIVLLVWYCRKKSTVLHRPNFLTKTQNDASFDRRLLWSETETDFWKHDREYTNRFTSFRSDLDSFSFNCPPVILNAAMTRTKFSIHEIEVATHGFTRESMIGGGDYSVVYHGVLQNNMRVAVKVLLHDGGYYQRPMTIEDDEFKREVEATTQISHRNLAKLLGYCLEGDYSQVGMDYNGILRFHPLTKRSVSASYDEFIVRMLVYQYVDNGSLHQWLHGHRGMVRPLTWDTRMKIILGTAKGLAYIHEDIEPKVVHLNVKSSNILLDQQWNPKISDLGLAGLYDYDCGDGMTPQHHSSYDTPERVSSGILTTKTDVYCFGILAMEIVTGRPQVVLLDWLKSMIADDKTKHVVDPKIPRLPSSKELKRVLLIALRCVDPDAGHRPTMGEVIHMFEPHDLLIEDQVALK